MRPIAALLLILSLPAAPAFTDEGMWPPERVSSLDMADLKARGLELTPDEIWNPEDGGLSRAVVNLEGCTASFVSAAGLVVSNHHCLFGAIQEHATPEHDYLEDGFVALDRAAELPARGFRLLVLRGFRDVTSRVRGAASAAGDDRQRTAAIERAKKELVASCEAPAATRCRVASFYGGLRYLLMESTEIRDVRLVYAPPLGVGEFGGEVDNWMWPRHTGDFSLVRAYVAPDGSPADYSPDNVPFVPDRHFKLSARGARPGDLVMVFGYPGRTERYLPEAAIVRNLEFWYPRRAEVFSDWLRLLEETTRDDPEGAIRVAGTKKSLANSIKNARGMMQGLRRNRVVQRKAEEERALRAWVHAEPSRADKYGSVLDALAAVYQDDADTREKDFLLRYLTRGSKLVGFATSLLRWSREQRKPDLDREPGYQERDRDRLRDRLQRDQKNLHPDADRAVLAYFLRRALDLPGDQRIGALDRVLEHALRPDADRDAIIEAFVERMYRNTSLTDLSSRLALFGAQRSVLDESDDPALVFARALEPELDAREERLKTRAGSLARLLPLHAELLIAARGGPVYPDANGTLRLSVATVKGYSPRDGVFMLPQTSLLGVIQKSTGEPPFRSPGDVLRKAREEDYARWAQDALSSVPVCFLSDADTTGGNSGSPVLNGRGELVGLNFDRVFENIAGDYGWSAEYSRNISVDVRYLLWMLDRVVGARSLLLELGIEPSPAE